MEMVRFTLTDGKKIEMTKDESDNLSLDGMMEAMEGKAVVEVEFYEDGGK